MLGCFPLLLSLPIISIFLITVLSYIMTIHFMLILQVEGKGCHGSMNLELPKILIKFLHNRSYQLQYRKPFLLIYNDMSYLEQRSLCHLCTHTQLYSANKGCAIIKVGHPVGSIALLAIFQLPECLYQSRIYLFLRC